MPKKLTVIIAYYKEEPSLLFRNMAMFNSQLLMNQGDVEYILINDGAPKEYHMTDAWLRQFTAIYPHLKHILHEKNEGCGMIQQVAIDMAKGDYIFMIDADDCLVDLCVLRRFLEDIYPMALDVIHTQWFGMQRRPIAPNDPLSGKEFLVPMNDENTWRMGKFYRRAFLEVNHIRHSPLLKVHEDSAFNRFCTAIQGCRVQYFGDFSTVVWFQSENSITRYNNAEYAYTSYATYTLMSDLLCEWIKARNIEQLDSTILQFITYSFIVIQNPEWFERRANEELIDELGGITYREYTLDWLSYFYLKWLEGDLKSRINARHNNPDPESVNADLMNSMEQMTLQQLGQLHGLPRQSLTSFCEDLIMRDIRERPKLNKVVIDVPKTNKYD